MSTYSLTVFLESRTSVRGSGVPNPVLYVEPDGRHQAGYVTFQIPDRCTAEEQVQIAEAFLKGVTEWRNSIVGKVEKDRALRDELKAARAEIARLKSETGDEDSEVGES
ncbi:hypothetical protein ACFY97_18405 [Streptomyces klenkii]|uniref:hypothetical protein n=1 Tax=Streptomyces klenkii TaxID=1420899 RepID=UPI0036E81DCD